MRSSSRTLVQAVRYNPTLQTRSGSGSSSSPLWSLWTVHKTFYSSSGGGSSGGNGVYQRLWNRVKGATPILTSSMLFSFGTRKPLLFMPERDGATFSTTATTNDTALSSSSKPTTSDLSIVASFQGKYLHSEEEKKRFQWLKYDAGEDAFFHHRTSSGFIFFGVADGVGGYKSRIVDPAEFAWKVVDGICSLVEKDETIEFPELVYEAQKQAAKTTVDGGSTICLLKYDINDSTLTTFNYGDSGFLVIRDGKLHCKSEPGQYSFNFPHQLACNPMASLIDIRHLGTRARLQTKPGDIIIVATDGFFDNLFDHTILQILEPYVPSLNKLSESGNEKKITEQLETISGMLLGTALKIMKNPQAETPFGVQSGRRFWGGKPDDCTILVAMVVSKDELVASSSSSSSSPEIKSKL